MVRVEVAQGAPGASRSTTITPRLNKSNGEIDVNRNTRYYWRVHARLPERFGQRCRVLVRGRMNSCLVEFEDGYRVVTSRYYVRRVRGNL
jgi:hypothetical protein